MKKIGHIRCPLCGKLSREKNFVNSPHVIEVLIQEIGGDKYIRWYKANDESLTKEVREYIIRKLEILLTRLKNEDQWHESPSILIRAVPSTSFSMTSVPSSSQKNDAT